MNETNSTDSAVSGIFSYLRGFVGTAIILAIIVSIAIYTFGTVVTPGMMGVRQVTFGPKQGFSRIGLTPGYHWSVPFYSKIHIVPQALQQLHLHRETQEEWGDSMGTLEVQTTDGSSVITDITVWYRFFTATTAEHGGPAELLQRVGTRDDWSQHTSTVVINELKKSLGRLSTSEFYNPSLREQEILKARAEMNKRLNEDGIEVEAVLLRRYTYAEERIDRAIFEKNLQDQEERLNSAASRLAQAKAELEKVAAEWDAKIETLRVDGINKVRVIRSEADLLEKSQIAEADLIVTETKADVEKKKAELLVRSAGAEVYVARELAPLLASLRGGVIEGTDPYDLEMWMRKLGVEKNGSEQ